MTESQGRVLSGLIVLVTAGTENSCCSKDVCDYFLDRNVNTL